MFFTDDNKKRMNFNFTNLSLQRLFLNVERMEHEIIKTVSKGEYFRQGTVKFPLEMIDKTLSKASHRAPEQMKRKTF